MNSARKTNWFRRLRLLDAFLRLLAELTAMSLSLGMAGNACLSGNASRFAELLSLCTVAFFLFLADFATLEKSLSENGISEQDNVP